MRDEWSEPQNRVVTPIGPAITLPPRAADGVRAHAESHAKLEDAGKRAGRRQAHDESLENPQFGICLHYPNERQDGLSSHKTIGIQRDGKFVFVAPLLAEIANVTRLVAGVDNTPAIGHRDTAVPDVGQLREALLLHCSDLRVTRVT